MYHIISMNSSIHYKVITQLDEAQEIWGNFSPHQVIDDEWNFRFAFYKYLDFQLHFIVGYDGNKPIGLLPLQYNTRKGLLPPQYEPKSNFLEFFGSDDTDDNQIWILPEYLEYETHFLEQIKQSAFLAPLIKPYANAAFYEEKFYLDLKYLESYDDYIEKRWEGSRKKKLKQQIRKLYRDYKIEILHNNYEDLELLFTLNLQRFGDTSSFQWEYRRNIFKDLIDLFPVATITIVINGKKEAISYGIKHKNKYIGMNAGANIAIPDLGKLLALLQIDHAIALKCDTYDAGKGSKGWKQEFKFVSVPQYKLEIS